MRNLFSLPLGASPHPLAFKCDPLSALGIGSIASGIVGGIGNMVGSLFSNSSNKKIAREQMDWQTKERNASQKWQEYMWNQNNLYNSPSAIKSRLQEAGYNPWLSGSEQVGQGATMPSAPSMPSAPNMPTQQPVNFGAPFAGMTGPLFNAAQLELNKQGVNASSNLDNAKAITEFAKSIPDLLKANVPISDIRSMAEKFLGANLGEQTYYSTYFDAALKYEKERANEQWYNSLLRETEYGLKALYGDQEIQAKINNLNTHSLQLHEDKMLKILQQELTEEEKKEVVAQIDKLGAEAGYSRSLMRTNDDVRKMVVGKAAVDFLLGLRDMKMKKGLETFLSSDPGKVYQVLMQIWSDAAGNSSKLMKGIPVPAP